ncbi:MAG: hypothetical protein DRO96_01585 [Candidatus Aenigmatarchaeota archaeon]|nr:MAG: hypothetical protein DRO96_01585 [Candidatus Aenigmarchaeota archaeon]
MTKRDSVEAQDVGELENILSQQEISSDMNFRDFLLVVGAYSSSMGPLGNKLKDQYWGAIQQRMRNRRASLPPEKKRLEARLCNTLPYVATYNCEPKFVLIKGICKKIEDDGLRIKQFGYKSLAYFNQLLEEYGMEPIKCGWRNQGEVTVMKRFGIQPGRKGY